MSSKDSNDIVTFLMDVNDNNNSFQEEKRQFLMCKINRLIKERKPKLKKTGYNDKYYRNMQQIIETKARYELLFDQLVSREERLDKREKELNQRELTINQREQLIDQRETAINIVSQGAKKANKIFN